MVRRVQVVVATLLLISTVVLVGCSPEAAIEAQEPSREPGDALSDLPDLVSAEGVVVPVREANLSLPLSGVVRTVAVQEGAQVAAGDLLVALDPRDLEVAVKQAEAQVAAAQAALARIKAGARPEEIEAAEAAVAIARSGVKAAEVARDVAAGNVASAEAALLDATVAITTAMTAVDVATGNLATAQAGVSAATANYRRLVSGPTDLEQRIARTQIEAARNELWGLQGQRDALGASHYREADYEAAQGQVAAAESRVAIAELRLQDMLNGPHPDDVAVANAQIAEAQGTVLTAQAQVQQAQAQVKSARARAQQAQASLDIAQGRLRQAEADIESAQARAAQAKAELSLLKAGARPEDIAAAEADVAQAEAGLAEATNGLADTRLVAPFGGVVGAILVKEGELAMPQMTVARVGDLSRLQIETQDLSEVDVRYVRVGAPAEVTVDALDGEVLTGTVAEIAPVARDRRGDKVYTVVIDLVEPPQGLLWGMTAYVEIVVE